MRWTWKFYAWATTTAFAAFLFSFFIGQRLNRLGVALLLAAFCVAVLLVRELLRGSRA